MPESAKADLERRRTALFADIALLFEFFSYDVGAVLERSIEAARRISRVDAYALLLLNAQGHISPFLSPGLKLDKAENLQLADFYQGETDLYVVCEVSPTTSNLLFPSDGPVRSYVTIPLVTHDDLVGLLMLGANAPTAFSDDDLDLLFSLGSHLAVALENIRHYQRAEERLKVLVALQESYRALTKEEDIDRILTHVADDALKTLNVSAMCVYLLDDVGGTWERHVFRAKMPSASSPSRVLAEELPAPISRALVASEMRLLSDLEIEQLGLFRFSPRPRRIIIIPLKAARTPSSGFALFESTAADGEQMRMIELFTNQVQILFANAMLIRGLRQQSTELEQSHKMVREFADRLQKSHELLETRVKELTTLYDVNLALATRTDVNDMLEFIMDESCTAMKAEKGSIFLLDNDELVAKCVRGVTADTTLRFKLGEGIAGWVAKRGQPYLSENIVTDSNFKLRPQRQPQEETLLAVPLKLENRVIGVLSIERDLKFGVFTTDEEQLLLSLATAAARAFEKAKHFDDLRELHKQTLEAFAQAVDTKDAYTHGHSRRVSQISVMLARMLRLPESEIEVIERAALLHDIGKIGISNNILFKPGKLTEEEYEIMKAHVIFGENIIKPIKRMAAEAHLIKHHHERWDGKGYSDGLKGEEIPIGSAIIGVADAYDTMTSDRPYRRATTREKAIEELQRCSGTQFNPLVVGALVMHFSREGGKGEASI